MRRETIISAGLFAGLALFVGCEPEKQLPSNVPPIENREAAPEVAVPTASQPEAVKLVERCVRATTDGHPERLDKAKSNRATLKGMLQTAAGFSERTRRIEAVWPDRFLLADEFNDNGPAGITIGLRRPTLWVRTRHNGEITNSDPVDPQAREPGVAEEAVGRHWMALVVPLVDRGTVVFGARKQPVAGQNADALTVAVGGKPPLYMVLLDEKTGLVRQVQFTHLEERASMQKEFAFDGHKAFGGLMLPTKIDHRLFGDLKEQWTVENWELVDRIEDRVFDPPAGKK